MQKVKIASTATAALGTPSVCSALPRESISTDGAASLIFAFGGTDAANEIINYQVVGYYELSGGTKDKKIYMPHVLAAGAATLGVKTFGFAGAALEAATSLFADTITDTAATKRARVYSPANDSIAFLEVDVRGMIAVEVQTDLNTAASASVFGERGYGPHGFTTPTT